MSGGEPAELDVLIRIAYSVHRAFNRVRRSPSRGTIVGMGAFGSPTEEIDRAAEAQVLASLESEGVDWDVLSEEAGHVRRGGARTLVVDPVDGSHNALRGLPFATVSLALGSKDLAGVDVAVVHDLFRGQTYWAVKGQGVYRDGHRIRPRTWDPRTELFLLNLGRHATPRSIQWAGKGRRTRSLGCASYELALVAEGSADAYFFENDPPTSNLRVTDIAAGYRILVEAGGGATDALGASLEETPLRLDQRRSVFAWGDPRFAASAGPEGYL
ncbi:MAG TPA: inositol monophosphatase family protein [Thermoplasmata archaeon]|nr:inositol monophosphatase family protein [Thermoplasmata archaeon]